MPGTRFVIDSLPRSGSTSLAKMLACHEQISCIVEPFHPSRYGGQYRGRVHDVTSLKQVLELIWLRWNGIKHVWVAPETFPFETLPSLNDELVLYAPAVISLQRRNLLQRHVSSMISRKLQFWIGTKNEFLARLEWGGLPELDVESVHRAIECDKHAVQQRRHLLSSRHDRVMFVDFEDIIDNNGIGTENYISQVNGILNFLSYSDLKPNDYMKGEWKEATDPSISKWNSQDVYERIPGIRHIEAKLGSDETGWLFR
jgi:hypothetical protein